MEFRGGRETTREETERGGREEAHTAIINQVHKSALCRVQYGIIFVQDCFLIIFQSFYRIKNIKNKKRATVSIYTA